MGIFSMMKYRVTLDNVVGDRVVGQTQLLFDAASLNRFLVERAEGDEYQVRKIFGIPQPGFHIESVSEETA